MQAQSKSTSTHHASWQKTSHLIRSAQRRREGLLPAAAPPQQESNTKKKEEKQKTKKNNNRLTEVKNIKIIMCKEEACPNSVRR